MTEIRQQMQEEAKKVFKVGANELFERYPDMVSFSWRQYTPYFNDGEPCEFGVRTSSDSINITLRSEDSEEYYYCRNCDLEIEYFFRDETHTARCNKCAWKLDARTRELGEQEEIDSWELPDGDPKEQWFEDVSDFLETFTEDDMRNMFGDHARIVASRQGVEVEHYEHD